MKSGAICLRWVDREVQVLLVKSSHKGLWVFPKGSAHDGEDPWSGAVRELQEEAGWSGHVDGIALGRYRQHEGEVVQAYLVKFAHRSGLPEGHREPKWMPLEWARNCFREQHDPATALSMVCILCDAVERWQAEER